MGGVPLILAQDSERMPPLMVFNRDPASESTQSWSLLCGLATPVAPGLEIILTMAVEPSSSDSMKRRVGRRWVIQIRGFWCHRCWRDSVQWETCCGCSDCDHRSLAGYRSSFVGRWAVGFMWEAGVPYVLVPCQEPLNLPSVSCLEKKKSKFLA